MWRKGRGIIHGVTTPSWRCHHEPLRVSTTGTAGSELDDRARARRESCVRPADGVKSLGKCARMRCAIARRSSMGVFSTYPSPKIAGPLSPSDRGTTWTCTWKTLWPALLPLFWKMLTPDAPNCRTGCRRDLFGMHEHGGPLLRRHVEHGDDMPVWDHQRCPWTLLPGIHEGADALEPAHERAWLIASEDFAERAHEIGCRRFHASCSMQPVRARGLRCRNGARASF